MSLFERWILVSEEFWADRIRCFLQITNTYFIVRCIHYAGWIDLTEHTS